MPKPNAKTTEVVASPKNDRRQRRNFSGPEKERILALADACTQRGQIGKLLRREGIYSSHLATWRAQRDAEGKAGLRRKKPGPKSTRDARDRLIEKQQRIIAKQEKELRIQRGLLDLQKKAHEILGIALPGLEGATEDDSSKSSNSAKRRSR